MIDGLEALTHRDEERRRHAAKKILADEFERSRARVGEQSIDDSILRLCESAVVAEQLGGLELLLELRL